MKIRRFKKEVFQATIIYALFVLGFWVLMRFPTPDWNFIIGVWIVGLACSLIAEAMAV